MCVWVKVKRVWQDFRIMVSAIWLGEEKSKIYEKV